MLSVNTYSRFNLINDNMWNILPESPLWIAYCDYALSITPVSVGHVSSKGPGCVARISVAPIFGEQPALGTPRCYYSWFKWSAMLSVNTEASCISLLLHFWCLYSKSVTGIAMIFMNVRSVKANCDTKRNKIQIWLYALDSQFRKYMMVFNYCSCIKKWQCL